MRWTSLMASRPLRPRPPRHLPSASSSRADAALADQRSSSTSAPSAPATRTGSDEANKPPPSALPTTKQLGRAREKLCQTAFGCSRVRTFGESIGAPAMVVAHLPRKHPIFRLGGSQPDRQPRAEPMPWRWRYTTSGCTMRSGTCGAELCPKSMATDGEPSWKALFVQFPDSVSRHAVPPPAACWRLRWRSVV